jgi:glycosyltransferase involved in cell wall biosynthesis
VTHIRFLPEKFPALLFRFWLSLHFKFSKHIISVSQFLANQIPPHKDLSVIYDRLPDESIPNFPTVGKNRNQTLLYLSNVIPGKGHDYAVEVFSRLLPDFPEWRLKFVGGDMGLLKNQVYKESLRQRCRELSIESNTIWCDFVDDVAREYETAEIALNFSESESFSLTTAEALFFGCPIVATACGGPSEIVDHDKTGFLVPAGNVAAMVSSLRVLMNDAQLRKSFSEEAQKSVRRKFATENTSDRLRQVYKTVLSGSPSEKND